ncbi:hypothetical protein EBZ37_12770, partial [bacterium]|nr:hypothetical protein [bacterium]
MIKSLMRNFGLATALLLGRIFRELEGRRPDGPDHWHPGVIFLLTLGAITYGTVSQMEIEVCLFQAAAWWAGLRAVRPGSHGDVAETEPARFAKPIWLFLALAIAGAASWVKSPLYSAFWVLGFALYLWRTGRGRLLLSRTFGAALSLGIAVGLAWFVAVWSVDGSKFWAEYVRYESVDKVAGNSSTVASIWYALLYFCFPFTLLMLAGVREVILEERREFPSFFLGWLLPPALFFSLYPYRVKTYLFILVPLLAITLARVPRRDWSLWIRVTSGVVPALILGGLSFLLAR